MVSNHEMVLIKIVRFEKTNIKIVSAKPQLSKIADNGQKMVSNDEMVLMKVVRFEITSIRIVSAKSQLSKIAENGPKMVLTEVIFKYVVVMKPTKLGMWFKLGF